jgi:hypothetical protein
VWGAVIDKDYPCQHWLTFRQALALAGRKGERATTVVYADRFVPEDERDRARRDRDEPSAPFLKRFAVFNVAQCEGLPESAFPPVAPLKEHDPIPRAEALIAASGADVLIRGDRAVYSSGLSRIQVPPLGAFVDATDYYVMTLRAGALDRARLAAEPRPVGTGRVPPAQGTGRAPCRRTSRCWSPGSRRSLRPTGWRCVWLHRSVRAARKRPAISACSTWAHAINST